MKNKRLRNYQQQKADQKLKSETIQDNPDKHIDQDFEGYPHAPASEKIINPKTSNEKKTAALNSKDGEKRNRPEETEEGMSGGSANAFDATERVQDDE